MNKLFLFLLYLLNIQINAYAKNEALSLEPFACVGDLHAEIHDPHDAKSKVTMNLQLAYDFNHGGKGHLAVTGEINKGNKQSFVSRNVDFDYSTDGIGEYDITIIDVNKHEDDNYPHNDIGLYLSMGHTKSVIYIDKIEEGYLFHNVYSPVFFCNSY